MRHSPSTSRCDINREGMRVKFTPPSGLWVLAVAALAAGAAAAPLVVAMVAAGVIAVAVRRWPEAALEISAFAVLAVRPSLDAFSERRFGLSEFAPSPAVVFGLGILWVAVMAALARARSGGRVWPSRALLRAHVWLLAAYGIAFTSGASLYGSAGAATGGRELLRVSSIVAALLIVLWWAEEDPGRYRRGWLYLVAGTVAPVAGALWQWTTGRGELGTEGFNRLLGTFSHPNSLGQYLVPFIILAVAGVPAARLARRLTLIACAAGVTGLGGLTCRRAAGFALLSWFAA